MTDLSWRVTSGDCCGDQIGQYGGARRDSRRRWRIGFGNFRIGCLQQLEMDESGRIGIRNRNIPIVADVSRSPRPERRGATLVFEFAGFVARFEQAPNRKDRTGCRTTDSRPGERLAIDVRNEAGDFAGRFQGDVQLGIGVAGRVVGVVAVAGRRAKERLCARGELAVPARAK